jgi:hypothetical protein
MREGMRRAICAVHVEFWEDCLYYRKHDGIAQCYFELLSQQFGEAKFISVEKSSPTPWTGAGVGFFSGVQYIIRVKGSEGFILGCAHASTTYGMLRIKSKPQAIDTDNTVY